MVDPIKNGFVRPFITVDLAFHQPMADDAGNPSHLVITGRLIGAMYANGIVHHFRIAGGDGVAWLVPPGWLTDASTRMAKAAMDRDDAAFLALCRYHGSDVVWQAIRKVTDTPEELTNAEAVAWLHQRQECLA